MAREPAVQAFLPEDGRFDRLRREAETLLAHYPDPANRPPLFGVPVGIKDIFHVAGFVTQAGSRLPAEMLQGPEATAVTRLKNAGALIMGKTVTTEFAYFAPGPTRNPHHPDHTPGGSSSGSAAAVGAGLCTLALGTQTIGSIVRPAAYCGVVGYKPSYDRISRQGVIPLAPSVDHVGVFAPDLASIQMVASLLAAEWETAVPERRPVLAIPEGPYLDNVSAEGMAYFEATCQRLTEAGLTVKSVAAMADFADIVARHNALVAAETAVVHKDWFARYGNSYHPKTAGLIRQGQAVAPEEFEAARHGREKLRQELAGLMDEHGIDLWLAPPSPGPAPAGLESTGDPIMNLPWTHSGLPSLNLPTGFNENGLPLGLQVIGRWYSDESLLAWAKEIERET